MTLPTKPLRIGLAMIVRNEAHVIVRCLQSVAPILDYWTIVDTGSTDGTQQLIRDTMATLGIPGELHERPWQDFGSNRSECLTLARPHADYSLVIDADETLQISPEFSKIGLIAPGYAVTKHLQTLRFHSVCLLHNRLPWCFKGVLHEYPDAGRPVRQSWLASLHILSVTEGARSRNPRKYHDDADVLAAAVEREPDNTRYHYYLAQSWRDAREYQRAHDAYGLRASMAGNPEEAWHAQYQQANMKALLKHAPAEIAEAYLTAWERRPERLEPLIWLASCWRQQQHWQRIRLLLSSITDEPAPLTGLFVEASCYSWRRHDELAIALFNLGQQEAAAASWTRALAATDTPSAQIERMQNSLALCTGSRKPAL